MWLVQCEDLGRSVRCFQRELIQMLCILRCFAVFALENTISGEIFI